MAACGLRERKLIGYRRGTFTILNHRGLVAATCGCYKTVKEVYARAQGKWEFTRRPRSSRTQKGQPPGTPAK
jgi:hypothetical protein